MARRHARGRQDGEDYRDEASAALRDDDACAIRPAPRPVDPAHCRAASQGHARRFRRDRRPRHDPRRRPGLSFQIEIAVARDIGRSQMSGALLMKAHGSACGARLRGRPLLLGSALSAVARPLMPSRHAIVCSPRAADRLEAASRWLQELEPSAEVMVLAARQPAADDLVRALSARRALFGVHRMTPTRLLGVLCAERLFRDGLVPAAGLGAEAVAARAIYKLAAAGALGYFTPVADRPGFPGALARTLGEVRLAGISAA